MTTPQNLRMLLPILMPRLNNFLLAALLLSCAFVNDAHAQITMQDVLRESTAPDTTTPQIAPAETPAIAPAAAVPAAAPVTAEAVAAPEETTAPTYEPQKFAILQTLDKVTARTATVEVPVGQAIAVGPLFLDVKTCQKTPPTEQPEASAFLQIWEATPKGKNKTETPSQWVFSGWMFASSPALSAIDHPIYDVWLKDCANEAATSQAK